MNADCGGMVEWHGCYSGSYDLWCPDAYSHPAKMSVALCHRILDHLEELGLLKAGDRVLDGMAGIGTTGLVAASRGYSAILVELEPKFRDLIEKNIDHLSKKLNRPLDITIIQGDARNLSGLLAEKGLVGVMSPPYIDSHQQNSTVGAGQNNIMDNWKTQAKGAYSANPSNIGNLRDVQLKAIMSPLNNNSLPAIIRQEENDATSEEMQRQQGSAGGDVSRPGFIPKTDSGDIWNSPNESVEDFQADGDNQPSSPRPQRGEALSVEGRSVEHILQDIVGEGTMRQMPINGENGYPPQGLRPLQQQPEQPGSPLSSLPSESSQDTESPGNQEQWPDRLGQITCITSPPYANPRSEAGDLGQDDYDKETGHEQGKGAFRGRYGTTEGQIGSLPDRIVSVTSPPYDSTGLEFSRHGLKKFEPGYSKLNRQGQTDQYGQSEGQLGQEKGESYLEAMRQVYAEIGKVADVLVVVVKNPTRNGKLRRLDLDTIALLETTGWTIHCHHHALLFEEQEQSHLFDGVQKKVKGRMSFFKRLSWQKGSPVAAWEDIIIAVREGNGLKAVMSPPFEESGPITGGAAKRERDFGHIGNWGNNYGDTPGQIGKLK